MFVYLIQMSYIHPNDKSGHDYKIGRRKLGEIRSIQTWKSGCWIGFAKPTLLEVLGKLCKTWNKPSMLVWGLGKVYQNIQLKLQSLKGVDSYYKTNKTTQIKIFMVHCFEGRAVTRSAGDWMISKNIEDGVYHSITLSKKFK